MGLAYSRKRLLLFIFPVYALILSCFFLKVFSPFYLSEPDPCYCYLFNGINLAGGSVEEQASKNLLQPGATIQSFASAVVFIKNLPIFSHPPIYQDVISNTESYLFTCSIVLILLFVCINYLTGAYIFRRSGSIGVAMVFQITPLINMNIIRRVVVLEPESLIIIASTFFMAYLFLNAPDNRIKENKPLSNKTIALFALFSGFLIASKYTCAPVVILVLFILQKTRQRILYLGMVIASFLIFILPVLPKIGNVFQWIRGAGIHNAISGNGAEQLINPSQFAENLKGIFLTDTIFTSIYILITIAFIVAIVNSLRKKEAIPFLGTISGVWFSVTALIMAVTKNPNFHYLIFAECCFPLGMVVSYKILSSSLTSFIQSYKKYEKRVVYSFLGALSIFLVIEKIRYIPLHPTKSIGINNYIDRYKEIPLIISVKSGLACERMEPALFLGYLYAANSQDEYAGFLNKTYPNTYIYWRGSQTLTHWNGTIPIKEFLNKNKSVLMYLKGYDDTAQVNIMRQFSTCDSNSAEYNEQEVYKDSETLQNVCLMTEAKREDVKGTVVDR